MLFPLNMIVGAGAFGSTTLIGQSLLEFVPPSLLAPLTVIPFDPTDAEQVTE
jgi:hypothetical protein